MNLKDLQNELELDFNNYGKELCDYSSGTINDAFEDIARGDNDMCDSDLEIWAKENPYMIELALKKGITNPRDARELAIVMQLYENKVGIICYFILEHLIEDMHIEELDRAVIRNIFHKVSLKPNTLLTDIIKVTEELASKETKTIKQ